MRIAKLGFIKHCGIDTVAIFMGLIMFVTLSITLFIVLVWGRRPTGSMGNRGQHISQNKKTEPDSEEEEHEEYLEKKDAFADLDAEL